MDIIPATLAGLVALWLIAKTNHNLPNNERLVVFRLGKCVGIAGPGLSLTVPFVDKVRRVDLDREAPNWPSLTAEQITDEIEQRLGLRR